MAASACTTLPGLDVNAGMQREPAGLRGAAMIALLITRFLARWRHPQRERLLAGARLTLRRMCSICATHAPPPRDHG